MRYRESTPSRIGRGSSQMVCDQGDYCAIDALVSEVAATHGRIDILVNNAGGTVPTPHVEDVPALVQQIQGAPRSDDDFERTVLFHSFAIQMNLISPLWFAIRVYRQMRDQEGTGSIVNISSGAGHPAGSPTLVSYGAAKAGLNHMTRSLAEEWGPHVRVNALALGPTMTDIFAASYCRKTIPTAPNISATFRCAAPASPPRWVVPACSCAVAQRISSTAPRLRSTAACCLACSTRPG